MREILAALSEYFAQSDGITIGIPAELAQAIASELRKVGEPIDMVLYCPACGTQHIDKEETPEPHMMGDRWTNPPHRSHLCASCGHIWRPADVPTNGVQTIETRGRADTDLAWMIKAIAAKRARDEQKVASFDQVLDLCGSWQDGSDTTVKISQDDACRCYVLTVGKNTFTAPSLTEALRLATSR